MSNSPLVDYTRISPNKNPRQGSIRKITPHHMAGDLSVERCGEVFASPAREASSNYGIGSDGRVGMYVPEDHRSWASSSPANDHQAVTIEVANDQIGGDWHVSDAAWNKLVELCVDICRRNGISGLSWTGGSDGTLTCHYMFAPTACPGPYLKGRMGELASTVNSILNGGTYAPPAPSGGGKSVGQLADEVIAGAWGNGSDRVNRLTSAGYDYNAVQAEVNRRLGAAPAPAPAPAPAQKSVAQLADEVLAGVHGNGDARRASLGSMYDEVQAEVNRRLGVTTTPAADIDALAHAVIRGDYGNGDVRRQKLGSLYDRVQARVNELLS